MGVPAISVAMSVYNNAPFLAEAVESILGQTVGDFEFLIVDDGSTDDSRPILEAYAARDERIRLLPQANRGLIASLNRLVGEARAPLIARMDGDDIALPERFARQLEFLGTHPDHGAVGTWTINIDARGREQPRESEDHPTSHEELLARLESGPVLCHPSVMMRTEVVRAAGGYRPLFRHCEDYDLWLRLSERTRMCSLPERLLRYRFSDAQVSSRHVVAQHVGAAIAFLSHEERIAGRPDPLEEAAALPALDELDRLFGRPGLGREVRAKVAPGIVYSPSALSGEGFRLLLDYVREGGARDGLWRTAGRLLKIGRPGRALRLAAALALR